MTVALLRHERELRWELVEAIPPSVATTTVEMPVGSDIRSFLHRIDVRALVRMRSERDVPIRHRIAAAQLRASGCRVLLATDRNIEFLNSLAELCPEVHQIIVGHGVLVPVLRARLEVSRGYSNRTFCVWSKREIEVVRRYAPMDLELVTLGSLRNALYVSSLTPKHKTETNPANQICLVSSFVGQAKEDQRRSRNDERWELRRFLLEAVRRLALVWSIPVVVALKPQTMSAYEGGARAKWHDERRYFERFLTGCQIRFSDPSNKFETYRLIDESALTLGLFTGSIVEGFGRGNVVISVGTQRLETSYGSLPSAFHITEAAISSLERQPMSQLKKMRDWLSGDSGSAVRSHFLESANNGNPVTQIQTMIANRLG